MLPALLVVLLLSETITSANTSCTLLSSSYFKWLNPDGSLVVPTSYGLTYARNELTEDCCGANCTEHWLPLSENRNCLFCISNRSLLCHGSDVYSVPSPSSLPSSTLSLFKMSGVGLISLPPNSFTGLSIEKLVIENSNLTYISTDAFVGVKSVQCLRLRNNTLDYLTQVEYSFESLTDLRFLDIENDGLRILSSVKSAKLQNLQYFSLAGNPIYTLDVFFLNNSGLRFLDLKNVDFRVKPHDLESSGFSSLPKTLETLDFSRAQISAKAIQKMLELLRDKNITTLNLSFLESFDLSSIASTPVRSSLKYLSFEGTNLSSAFPIKEMVLKVLNIQKFINLKELNMKNCNIQTLGTGKVFEAFPNLNVLSLSNNHFTSLDTAYFSYHPDLKYLDLSSNCITAICNTCNKTSFNYSSTYHSLEVLDLSSVSLEVNENQTNILFSYFLQVEKLSLCNAIINSSHVISMQKLKKLKVLDLSKTLPDSTNLISAYNEYFTLPNSTLTKLRFTSNNFAYPIYYPSFFSSISSLKSLDLSNNIIRSIQPDMFGTQLEHLVLSQNLITSWYFPTISNGSQLKSLDLSCNQITFVSRAMVNDFFQLTTLNLTTNPLICNLKIVYSICKIIWNKKHNLTMENYQQMYCYDVISSRNLMFTTSQDCDDYLAEDTSTPEASGGGNGHHSQPNSSLAVFRWDSLWPYVIVSLMVTFTILGSVMYVKWWNIRCYFHRYISLRKARLLRRNGEALMKSEIHYDVFVSYSDVDRSWILDHLIPNMEYDGDINLCFHERDFKVGLSILENIIECMDRSNSLLLIVSSAFVRSKWCQFEMHLAQYRLIETIRDQLVLVLLEDIPRKVRPQTLHHLMMTKTYLIWPEQPAKPEVMELFWKRLRRALRPSNIFQV